MLPALQNSGRAKWGSARADRILKSRVSEKMGSPLQESANLQMSTAAPDFCFSRAQRLWDVICAIWDLLRCTEICKSAVIEFSAGREICLADFSICCRLFLLPRTSLLGSGICFLRARRLGRGAWFVSCSWHTVPSWSAANEVQDMLRLRARAAARPMQGMRRWAAAAASASTGGSATTATARSVAAAASLRAQAAAQPVQRVWPQQLLRARAPARLLQL